MSPLQFNPNLLQRYNNIFSKLYQFLLTLRPFGRKI
nr:MAG TPA: hypothetical protein [Caudoviricetes sp.]